MNIENMPEDELDDLFRKSAAGYEPEFEPEAWRAMERKLDAHAQTQTLLKRLLYLGAILLLVVPASYFGTQSLTQPTDAETGNIASTKATKIEPKKEVKGGAKISGAPIQVKTENTDKTAVKTDPENIVPANPGAFTTAEITTKKPDLYKIAKTSTSTKKEKKYIFIAGKSTQNSTVVNDNPINIPVENIPAENAEFNLPAIENIATPVTLLPIDKQNELSAPDLLPMPVLTTNASLPESRNQDKNNLKALNRFTISLLAAPDLTTVGFKNPGGISTNGGVAVSYHITDKLMLSSGIIKANKIYGAKPEDYHNPGYAWPASYTPYAIDAVCKVLDIPVNISYTFWQKNKNALTVQTGLSSYIMQSEKYDYRYKTYAADHVVNYNYSNENKHLFSIYNLSLGYSRQISNSIAVGAEPFIKVPLTGVGAGKVKLTSAGVFFSLSYRYSK